MVNRQGGVQAKGNTRTTAAVHADHTHEHGPNCGHLAISHLDHTNYVHAGHIRCIIDGESVECDIAVCTLQEDHDQEHGPDCGHVAVPHGDHIDYIPDGHRHRSHGNR